MWRTSTPVSSVCCTRSVFASGDHQKPRLRLISSWATNSAVPCETVAVAPAVIARSVPAAGSITWSSRSAPAAATKRPSGEKRGSIQPEPGSAVTLRDARSTR